MKNAIVFGAKSTIAECVIYKLAATGYNLYLFARDVNQLQMLQQDLEVKYPQLRIHTASYDAEHDINDKLSDKIAEAFAVLGTIDLVLIAHGNLPEQQRCATNWRDAKSALQINGLSAIEICHNIADKLRLQRYGTIVVISSVAGERGRQSNYIYGTAKGMLNIYLQGLRNSVAPDNVHVLTIMPGFVDTKMTSAFKKGLLWASPDKVATDIISAINKNKNIVYTPWFWRYIMLIIKSIPEGIFKKLKL